MAWQRRGRKGNNLALKGQQCRWNNKHMPLIFVLPPFLIARVGLLSLSLSISTLARLKVMAVKVHTRWHKIPLLSDTLTFNEWKPLDRRRFLNQFPPDLLTKYLNVNTAALDYLLKWIREDQHLLLALGLTTTLSLSTCVCLPSTTYHSHHPSHSSTAIVLWRKK